LDKQPKEIVHRQKQETGGRKNQKVVGLNEMEKRRCETKNQKRENNSGEVEPISCEEKKGTTKKISLGAPVSQRFGRQPGKLPKGKK